MSNIIQIKRGAGKPANGSLVPYELGYDTTNGYLYIGTGTLDSPTVGGIKVDYAASANSANSATSLTSTLPIKKGGTGATTAAAALTNLGITATATELNYITGVTSGIQSQLNGKSNTGHTHDDRYYTESEVNTKLDGKANSSHGTHVSYGTSASALGTSSAGTASTVSRSDHVHALPALTSCTGTLTVAKGGTGSSNGATGLKNLFAAGNTILSSYQYGKTLPSTGTAGQLFFLLDE